jgi:hypothetical protein
MATVPKDDIRTLLYLVPLVAVGAAAVGLFFGVGFSWLGLPYPAAPPVDPVLPAQALEAHRVPPPGNDDTAWGSLPEASVDKVAASPTPAAPSNRKVLPRRPTAMETTLVPPAGITHAKTVRIGRHRHQGTASHYWAALWRPDASAGPNPGGGFYGPPNINIGYINPK